ncbi:CDP-diacylglycerol-serine O-phosphatidyltransferase [Dimargaris verticillata]|uniref:CDP-diacylglycerol--serine O-phosphatidyltransferase n=1 Tax=Dimargaris verticillata TaxID=2761393 RepID=A0A9W8ECL2_9FUNG|nr:CDP-diacylglycerol-serine O-phosphatidyltransferase [Dimargaris verticillata]
MPLRTRSQRAADFTPSDKPTEPALEPPTAHFSLVRSFHLADFLTLGNGVCGISSILCSMQALVTGDSAYLWTALAFIPLGGTLDVLDGRVARWRQKSSLLGQELDSLADLVSFGVAPAAVGFALGLQTPLDMAALAYFVVCGIARLARFNATVASLPKNASGKVNYFEGTPIPSSLTIVGLLAWLLFTHRLGTGQIPGGLYHVSPGLALHPLVLVYVLNGTTMISRTLQIPKL